MCFDQYPAANKSEAAINSPSKLACFGVFFQIETLKVRSSSLLVPALHKSVVPNDTSATRHLPKRQRLGAPIPATQWRVRAAPVA
jgi:hypothetical protein